MRKTVMDAFVEFKQKSRYRNIRLIIDVDPQSVMRKSDFNLNYA